MTNWWLVYLLSVADGVSRVFIMLGLSSLFVCAACAMISILSMGEDGSKESAAAAKICKSLLAPALAATLISALIPNSDDMARAYLMVEGAEIVTAENAEAAAKAVGERLDKVIDALTKKAEP